MTSRELKGLEIAARMPIHFRNGVWVVPSLSGNRPYVVNLTQGDLFCNCEDFELTQEPCKHVFAAQYVRDRDKTKPTSRVYSGDPLPVKKTYKQNWPKYDLAQQTEKHRFQSLLAELCAGVDGPPLPHTGRHPVPTCDRLFSMIFKVYSTFSVRRFACDLKDAFEKGHTSRPLHPAKVSHFMCETEMTDCLRELVVRSSLPLKAIETDFAVDSTGFSTCKFIRWFDEKYGQQRSGHDWIKAHACCGVQTGIITAVEIKERDAHDCPILPELVGETAKNFTIGKVLGDKGYLSAQNVNTVAMFGGEAFIAPKVNSVGKVAGGLFEKMINCYRYRREEFLKYYHQRSNIESVFSAMKRKLGDSVRSKNPVAMINEAYAKFVAYNLTVVIRSQVELGIDAEFWSDNRQAC